jgi:hypothetical protein
MKVTGPLLVFGGPYSNLEATKAMLAEARRRAIAPGNIVCTGDLVAIAPTRQKLERPALAREGKQNGRRPASRTAPAG